MSKSDSLHRFIFENAPVRGEFIHLSESFQTIMAQHSYPEPIRKLLGEALCVAGLLSAIIKFKGRLTLQFRGKGKLKFLLAQCDNQFHIRGLAKWEGEISPDELMETFAEGVLVIMLDTGKSQQRYQGIVPWEGNSLVASIEGYFKNSEQLATKLWLSVDEHSAAGLLLQVVPSQQNSVDMIEQEVIMPHWEHMLKLTSMLRPADMNNLDYQTLLVALYPEEQIRVFPSVDIKFHCACTRKRGEDAIAVLGREEAEEELRDKHSIAVTCEFCNREYVFDRVDVAKIFEDKGSPPKDTHLH